MSRANNKTKRVFITISIVSGSLILVGSFLSIIFDALSSAEIFNWLEFLKDENNVKSIISLLTAFFGSWMGFYYSSKSK